MPQKAATRRPLNSADSQRIAAGIDQLLRPVGQFQPGSARRQPADFLLQRRTLGRIHGIGAGQPDHLGAGESCERLAQQPARQHMSIAKRFERIDQHDIEIPVDPAVLEGIVEHNRLAPQLADGGPGRGHAIGVLEMRHLGQATLQFECFVIRALARALCIRD